MARLYRLLLALVLLFWAGPALAAERPVVIISQISWEKNQLVIRAESALNPRLLTLSNPDRVVLDLLDAELADPSLAETIRVRHHSINQIRIAQHGEGFLRLVLDCSRPTIIQLSQARNSNTLVAQSNDFSDLQAAFPTLTPVPSQRPVLRPTPKATATPKPRLAKALPTPKPQSPKLPLPIKYPTPPPIPTWEPTARPLPPMPSRPEPTSTPMPVASVWETPRPGARKITLALTSKKGHTTLVVDGVRPATCQVSRRYAPSRVVVRIKNAALGGNLPDPCGDVEQLGTHVEGGDLLVELSVHEGGLKLVQEPRGDRLRLTWSAQPKLRAPLATVVLDPGHGGVDPGAVGQNGLHESTVNLEVAHRLREELKKYQINAILTRESDTTMDLASRPTMAEQQGATMLVSLHCNAYPGTEATGAETYYRTPDSYGLAKRLHRHLIDDLGRPDRGVKQARLYVLRSARFPSALIETAFISHVAEEALLADPDFQTRTAQAIAGGIYEYLTSPSLEETPSATTSQEK